MDTYDESIYGRWDTTAKAAYFSINNPGSADDKFISYDNEQSCTEKVNYARSKGVGGLIIWELAGGYRPGQPVGQRQPLVQAIKEALLLGVAGDGRNPIPSAFRLSQNYPNPFNPASEIRYDVPTASHVKIVVYDLLGREVATLLDDARSPGTYTARFNGNDRPSGVYFYRLSAVSLSDPSRTFAESRKMILMK